MTMRAELGALEQKVDMLVEIITKMHDIQRAQEESLIKLRDAIITVSGGMEKHMGLTGDLANAIAALATPFVGKDIH